MLGAGPATARAWRRPKHELLLLALVAVAALSPVSAGQTQDVSRLCLTRALTHLELTIEPCAAETYDRASYEGRTYSDKAPGLSVLALPAAEVTRLPPAGQLDGKIDARLWGVRVLTTGLAFVLLAFAVGRVSEGLRPGFGGPALVTFALGTLVAPLAATMFEHVTAGALAFAAFVLAWRGRPGLAGAAAGLAATSNYVTGLIGVVLAVYVLASGARPLLRYALGALPPLALLGAYNWAAFGSPFHLSYRYVVENSADLGSGFFGIHLPRAAGTEDVLVGDRGVLLHSPVLVVAAAGLVLLARTDRREAIACGAAAAVMFVVTFGYWAPYGGLSPGPRFLIPALPFLAVGLAPAFARWRLATTVLAGASLVATTVLTLTWAEIVTYRQSAWGELARVLWQGLGSRLEDTLLANALEWIGIGRLLAALVAVTCAAAALGLALRDAPRRLRE